MKHTEVQILHMLLCTPAPARCYCAPTLCKRLCCRWHRDTMQTGVIWCRPHPSPPQRVMSATRAESPGHRRGVTGCPGRAACLPAAAPVTLLSPAEQGPSANRNQPTDRPRDGRGGSGGKGRLHTGRIVLSRGGWRLGAEPARRTDSAWLVGTGPLSQPDPVPGDLEWRGKQCQIAAGCLPVVRCRRPAECEDDDRVARRPSKRPLRGARPR